MLNSVRPSHWWQAGEVSPRDDERWSCAPRPFRGNVRQVVVHEVKHAAIADSVLWLAPRHVLLLDGSRHEESAFALDTRFAYHGAIKGLSPIHPLSDFLLAHLLDLFLIQVTPPYRLSFGST